MGERSSIEWTDHTFNAWNGCTRVSPGCQHCYAETLDRRHMRGADDHWGPGAPRELLSEQHWEEPLRWARRIQKAGGPKELVFTSSTADVFDPEGPARERQRLWWTIAATSEQLIWQVLTKRPERIRETMLADGLPENFFERHSCALGASVENQKYLNQRLPDLFSLNLRWRFISAEPLLGPLDLRAVCFETKGSGGPAYVDICEGTFSSVAGSGLKGPKIDWVICGGESGPGARPMNPDWARRLRDQCRAAAVPFFFKQWGAWKKYNPIQHGSNEKRHFIDWQGRLLGPHEPNPDGLDMRDWERIVRSGNKDADARLDGVEWRQFPKEWQRHPVGDL